MSTRVSRLIFCLGVTLLCLPGKVWAAAPLLPNAPWHLAGTAAANQAGRIVLTRDTGGQNGAAWYECQINITQPFDLTFMMNFGTQACGADGMAFVLQNDSQGVGGNAGDHAADAFTHAVDVEFDTYTNTVAPYSDPPYDSLGIQTGGVIQDAGPASCGGTGVVTGPTGCGRPAISSSQFNIKDGNDHTVEITWDPTTQSLKVFVDGDPTYRAWWTLPATYVSTLFNNNSNVWFGFTAATGGSVNYQEIGLISGTVNGGTNINGYGCAATPTNTPVASPTFAVIPPNPCGTATNMPSFTYSPTPAPTATSTPTITVSPTPYPAGCGPPSALAHQFLASGCNPTPVAFNNPGGANGLLLIRVEKGGSGGTPTGISYNGLPMTLASTDPGASGGSFISTWYLVNPPSGSHNVVFTGTTGCSYNIEAEVYTGVDPASPIGNISAGTGTSYTITPSVSYGLYLTFTAQIAASIVSDYIAMPQVPNVTYGPGQTSYNWQAVDGCCDNVTGDYKTLAVSGTGHMTYTQDQSKNYGYQIVEIRGFVTCGTPTFTPTSSNTPSVTLSGTPTATPTSTFTPSATRTPSPSNTPSPSPSDTPSPTPTITQSNTPGPSPTPSVTSTATPSYTPTSTSTDSPSPSPSPSETPSRTPTATPSATPTGTPSFSPSVTATPTATITTPFTSTNTPTASPSFSPSPSFTQTDTFSATPTPTPSATPSDSFTPTPSLTASPTATPSATPSNSFTATPSLTDSPTATPSLTASPTRSPSSTPTNSPTATPSATISPTFSVSPTHSPSPVPAPNHLTVSVYNTAGELVTQLFDGGASMVPTELLLSTGSVVNTDPAGVSILLPGSLQSGGVTQTGLTWLLNNSSGQRVGGGVYYIKAEYRDPFGAVSSFTKGVQVLQDPTGDMVRIYNSAGEVVWSQPLTISAASLDVPSDGVFAPEFDAQGVLLNGSLGLAVRDRAGNSYPLSFDGRNQAGQPLDSGSYLIQVVHVGAEGEQLLLAHSLSLLKTVAPHPLDAAILGPNPARRGQAVQLHYPSAPGRSCVAEAYALDGELVARGEDRAQSGAVTLPLDDRASGIYVVRVRLFQFGAASDERVIKLAVVH
jgi:hypothetical protein